MDNKCNLFEYAISGVYNRKFFYEENGIPDFLGQEEIYHSAFLHSSEIIEYADQNDGIIKGYAGCVAIREVVIDIDCGDNLAKAQKITQGIVQKFETLYEVDAKNFRVNFSGSKGFHIRIPSVLFGGFLPSEDLPEQIRAIVKEITAGYEHVDYGIYGTTKLIREVNTINGKSGLVAVPLTAAEVNCLTIAEIKNLAKSPRLVEYLDDDELLPNEGLVALKNNIITTGLLAETKDIEVQKNIDAFEITEGGLPEGERHAGLVKLVSHFIHYNVPDKTIYAMAQLFNRNNNPPKDSAVVKGEVDGILKQYGKIKGDFWTVARNKKGYINVDVNHFQLIKFLESHGFAKLYLTNSFTYVKAVDNRIKEKMPQEIKDFILNSVKKDNQKGLSNDFRDEVMNELIAHNGKYLSDKLFECVESKEMELLKDTAKLGRVFFKNCFVEVTEDNIITRPYTELDGLIWDAQIIDNDFTIADDFEKSMFRKFLWNVSAEREDRFNSLVSSIGYLLHGYKNSSNAKAIVFCDEKISDDPNGRTGKSLASVAISKMKESVRMDGKTVNFNDRFVYQQVERSTQVLEFNDIRKSFDFEGLFGVITDALNVEKKNGQKFAVGFKESPKVLISTNYTIKGTGDSFADRLFEIEFAPYYNATHKPSDDFGCVFFDGWDQEEWDKFYSFMLWCEQFYLKHGLVTCEKVNLGIRKLMDNTSPEFLTFVQDSIMVGLEYDKNEMYYKFTTQYRDFDSVKQRTFTKWLSHYADSKGFEFDTRESNGKGFFTIRPKRVSLFN